MMTNTYGNPGMLYGNYIWPCADILVQFINKNKSLFENKTVLEIGSGVHALCGKKAAEVGAIVTITDGHADIVARIDALNCKVCKLEYGEIIGKYDIIIGADVYYGGLNVDLFWKTIRESLNPGGKCYLALEQRVFEKLNGEILEEISQNDFDINQYDINIHQYIKNTKYIVCITNTFITL